MSERVLDLAAAARIARRVNLNEIFVVTVSAKRHESPKNELQSALTDAYEFTRAENKLQIHCHHDLHASSANEPVADLHVDLNLVYDIIGVEPINDNDLGAFANANGAYHSWPFIREIFHSLTVRMGLPPFVLPPLLVISPKPQLATSPQVEPAEQPADKA